MPWVRFIADFDFKPVPGVTIGYLAGMEKNVTTPCAGAAVDAGKAVRLKKSTKTAAPIEVSDDDGWTV